VRCNIYGCATGDKSLAKMGIRGRLTITTCLVLYIDFSRANWGIFGKLHIYGELDFWDLGEVLKMIHFIIILEIIALGGY